MTSPSKFRFAAAAAFGLAMLPLAIPSTARAWWSGDVYIGSTPPVIVNPPVYSAPAYAPPPVYSESPEAYQYQLPPQPYQPPQPYPESPDAYTAPPAAYPDVPSSYAVPNIYESQTVPPGRSCFAGPYYCPLDRPTPAGSPCSCPSHGGGWISGQAG